MVGESDGAFPRAASARHLAGYGVILVVAGTVLSLAPGAILYAVTTFLFAFSGGQRRMVPVVGWGVWLVLLVALAAGLAALVWTRSLTRAGTATFVAYCLGWPLAILVEWWLSFSLGAG